MLQKSCFNVVIDGDWTKLLINVKEESTNLLQYLHQLGRDIPYFCYHERLGIAGNCRMCLVETYMSKKLQVACSLIITNNLQVITLSKRVKKAQEAVLGFLLSNHPLDCPICDQGGECDLQDLTLLYGSDRNSFYEIEKRSVLDKNFGIIVKTSMNRCIHCMRCVRFYKDIYGLPVLSMIGRGVTSEIDTYVNFNLDDELSGNIIDLCPVGALTAKVYSFQYRVWEFKSYKIVDFLDSLNSEICFNIFGNKLIRVLPEINCMINENWISNKTRFAYDLLNVKKRFTCLWNIKFNQHFKYIELTYNAVSHVFLYYLYCYKWEIVLPYISCLTELLDFLCFKNFCNSIGLDNLYTTGQNFLAFDFRSNFYLYWGLEDFKHFSSCFFIGVNTRLEFPVLNIKLRSIWIENKVFFFNIGSLQTTTTFDVVNISKNLFFFLFILEGRSLFCRVFLYNIYNFFSFFFLGSSVLKNNKGHIFLALFFKFIDLYIKILHMSSFFYLLNKGLDFFSFFALLPNYSTYLITTELNVGNKVFNFYLKFLNKDLKILNFFETKLKSITYFFYLYGINNWKNYYFAYGKNKKFSIMQGSYHIDLKFFGYSLYIPVLNFFEKTSITFNILLKISIVNKLFVYDNDLLNNEDFFINTLNKFNSIFRNFQFYLGLNVNCVKSLHLFFFDKINNNIYITFFKNVFFNICNINTTSIFFTNNKLLNWNFFFFFKN